MILCRPTDIMMAWAWARGVCHSVLGPVEGEKLARGLPVLSIMQFWTRVEVAEA